MSDDSRKLNEKQSKSKSNLASKEESAGTPTFSRADAEQVLDLLNSLSNKSCELKIVNETPWLMVHSSHYADDGTFLPDMSYLPAVAPMVTTTSGDTYVFEQAVAVESTNAGSPAPTAVAVWEFIDVPNEDTIYLIVFANLGTTTENEGYFHLSHKKKKAKDWLDYMEGKELDYGSLSGHTQTIGSSSGGVTVSGSMTSPVFGAVLEVVLKPA